MMLIALLKKSRKGKVNHPVHHITGKAEVKIMEKKLFFIKLVLWLGIIMDFVSCLPLLVPSLGAKMYGIPIVPSGEDYLYVSRMSAVFMFGWTLLLLWAVLKPVERRGVILLTVFPVLIGLAVSPLRAVMSGMIKLPYIAPLWIWQGILVGLFLLAYIFARQLEKDTYGKT